MARLHAASFTTPRPWSADEISALLASPGAFLLTEPDGFLIGRAIAGEAELLTVAVDPDARRRGTGAWLVQAFLDQARRRGADTAFLEVAADNTAATALYRDAGFAEAGRRPGYYAQASGEPLDALILRRDLV